MSVEKLMPRLTALSKMKPIGIVYRARVALKNPMSGISGVIASLGMPNPIGGGSGRQIQLMIVIVMTLAMMPDAVETAVANASC